MTKDTIEFSLEQTRAKFLESLSLIHEYEKVFRPKYDRAKENNKDGFYTSRHEFLCTVRWFNSLHADLMTSYQVLFNSMKHLAFQNRILESHLRHSLEGEVLESIKRKSA